MASVSRLTTTELAKRIASQFGRKMSVSKIRWAVDLLDARGRIEVQRVAQVRTIAESDVSAVADELIRLGWLSSRKEAVV